MRETFLDACEFLLEVPELPPLKRRESDNKDTKEGYEDVE
jgi:hypothetical protein